MSPTDKPEEMASIPVCYMTAVYALMHLARLTLGEKVLIQAATGGVGMAALRIAKYLGADVYATVGTKGKEDVLVEKFGIPRNQIFSSRDASTPAKIWDATGETGIDVILSSSSGEHMQETWRCIASLGRFVEIGRLDVLERGSLPLGVFERNAMFTSFDMGLISRQKPILFAG
jgi:NADPH:quinone reductase-like Zn-dependent oxidoreductase